MKNILVVIIAFLLVAGLSFGTYLYMEARKKVELSRHDKELLENLTEIYNQTIKNPYTAIDTSKEYYSKLVSHEEYKIHLEDLHTFVSHNIKNADTLDYQSMYTQTQSNLQNAQTLIEEIKQDKKVEVEKQKELIDSLNNIKNNLVKRTAEKEQALNRNVQNMDSLKSVIDLYEENRKEILHFKSPTGVDVTYFGQTRNDKAHGNGIGVYANGNKYEGQWENGQKHGEGVYEFPDGETYVGRFEKDKRNGYGLYKWPNGDVYTGYWKNDRRHGEGVIKNKSGKVLSTGLWTNDLLEKTKKVDF